MKTSSSSPSASPYSSSVEGNYSQHTKGKHKAGVLHKLGKWLGASSSANSSAANKPLSASQLAAYPNAISTPANRYNESAVKQALAREMARFGYGLPAEEVFQHSLQRKDANPALAHMPDDEYLALRMYTSTLFRAVNHQLRDGKPSSDMQLVVEAMQNGLRRLAENPANVAQTTLYRGINKGVSDQFIHSNFQLHGLYRDKTFVSASQDPTLVTSSFTTLTIKNKHATADQDRYQKSPLLEIESQSAVRVDELSMSRDEQEALFQPNTPFLVTAKDKTDSGRWHIKLQEMPELPSSD